VTCGNALFYRLLNLLDCFGVAALLNKSKFNNNVLFLGNIKSTVTVPKKYRRLSLCERIVTLYLSVIWSQYLINLSK